MQSKLKGTKRTQKKKNNNIVLFLKEKITQNKETNKQTNKQTKKTNENKRIVNDPKISYGILFLFNLSFVG